MSKQSNNIASFTIQEILHKVWLSVAQKNLQKMAPSNIQKMNEYTFQTIAELHSQYLQAMDKINNVNDLNCIPYDNLLNSYVKLEKTKRYISQKSQTANIQISSNRFQLAKSRQTRNKNTLDNNSFISNQKSKNTTHRSKKSVNNPFIDLSKIQNEQKIINTQTGRQKNEVINKNIQDLRKRIILGQQLRKKQQDQFKTKQQTNIQRLQDLKKKKKQIQKLAYDYDGNFFGSKVPNPENTLGAATRIKLQLQKQTPKNQKVKLQKVKPNFTTLINQKLQERHKRIATQQIQMQKNKQLFKQSAIIRFSKSFIQDDTLSEGISITETTSNFKKMKPLSRIGQKITLSEYKRQITNKKFKQFRLKPAKTIQTIQSDKKIINNNKLSSYKSQQNFVQKNFKHKQLSQKVRHLTDHNKRYKTTFGSQQSSILQSNSLYPKTLNSGTKRGTIKVSNQSLYQIVLNNQD